MTPADGALLILGCVIAWSLYRAQRDETIAFNLLDLVVERGRVSKLAFAFMLGLIVLSWIMVTLTMKGEMTEGYVGLYGGIVIAPVIAKLFSPTVPETTTTEITTATTQTISKEKP